MTLTRNAASALNRYKIRVNQLNVGWTLTESEDAVQKREGTRTDWLADAVAIMPFGRLLTPHEIALAAAYFASDDSALITGAVLDMEQYPVGALRRTGERRCASGDARRWFFSLRGACSDRRRRDPRRRAVAPVPRP